MVVSTKRQKIRRIKTDEMETALADYYNMRQKLIVPNISWGMLNHEADLLILTPAGYATEIEIKVSRSDLIKDKDKWHGHKDKLIHSLFFAIPSYLEKDIEHIPEHAGILSVTATDNMNYKGLPYYRVRTLRAAVKNKYPKWTDSQRMDLMRLSTMRIWSLKEKLLKKRLKEKG